jgi:N-acetylneuraminate synthase
VKTKIVAEIGINHNGSLKLAKDLIEVAKFAGCDYVKFQKRTPELCVPNHMKNEFRKTPWGEMSYLEYKKKLEFGKEEYDQIASYCEKSKIGMFLSVWDVPSLDFASSYSEIVKIPSAMITDHTLAEASRAKSRTLMMSTGMSDESEIDEAVEVANPDVIFHTNSSYPSPIEELNLAYIGWLKEKHKGKSIGYSGHEFGLTTTFAAVVMGAEWIERHVTLDRTMWGSDQKCSVEPIGLIKLVKGIRDIESSIGKGGPRVAAPSELQKKEELRK